jgi:glycerol uptake facilitator-like aquaporin
MLPPVTLSRRLASEALGTALLVAAVVGSGIMGERLAGGNKAVALLANTLATGAALATILLMLSPISGAHLNPVVSIASAFEGQLSWRDVPAYVAVQTGGAIVGVALANLMFDEPVFRASHQVRQGTGQLLSESVATFGLLATIWTCSRRRPAAVPGAVAAYIVAAYWFTASTSFANPAVTLARSMTDTFAGIRPSDVPLFVAAQAVGAAIATVLCRWLVPAQPDARENA